MGTYWDLYQNRLNLHGTTRRERKIYDFQKSKLTKGIDNPSCKHILINGIEKDVLINSKTDKSKYSCTPISTDDIIHKGDKIIWGDNTYLVIEMNYDQDVYIDSTIQRCNYTLPFQLNSSTIIYEPCIVTDNQTTVGVDSNNVITIPNVYKHFLVQYNEDTIKLLEDKRLFIDMKCENPSVYKITKIDRVIYMDGEHGLLYITCQKDSYNANTDNKDTLIADEYKGQDTPTPTPPSQSSGTAYMTHNNGNLYTSTDTLIVKEGKAASGMPVNAIFKNSDGNIVSDVIPAWSVDNFSNITIDEIKLSSVDDYPMRIIVSVNADDNLIGATFQLHLKDSDEKYTENILNCKVTSLY